MLQRSEHPLAEPELPAFDEDPAFFDPSPQWFVPGVKPLAGEVAEEDEALGLRSLLEQPEALAKAWRATRSDRPVARTRRAHRPRRRRAERSRDRSHHV